MTSRLLTRAVGATVATLLLVPLGVALTAAPAKAETCTTCEGGGDEGPEPTPKPPRTVAPPTTRPTTTQPPATQPPATQPPAPQPPAPLPTQPPCVRQVQTSESIQIVIDPMNRQDRDNQTFTRLDGITGPFGHYQNTTGSYFRPDNSVNGYTRTMNNAFWDGFRGRVVVHFADSCGNELGAINGPTFGMDAAGFGPMRSRTDAWSNYDAPYAVQRYAASAIAFSDYENSIVFWDNLFQFIIKAAAAADPVLNVIAKAKTIFG
jgi:hypothetical protein